MKERDFYRFAATTVLAASLLTSVDISPKRSDCVGKIDWEAKNKIAVCKNNENRVTVELRDGTPYELPTGICRVTQVWKSFNEEDEIRWYRYLDSPWDFQFGSLNLKTGVEGKRDTYHVPNYGYYYSSTELYCKK